MKNAQWKIALLGFKLCEGMLVLYTPILDEQFLMNKITIKQ